MAKAQSRQTDLKHKLVLRKKQPSGGRALRTLLALYFVISALGIVGIAWFAHASLSSLQSSSSQAITESVSSMTHDSHVALNRMAEALIQNEAQDTAGQLSLLLMARPGLTMSSLLEDPDFLRIIQEPVGESGYSALITFDGVIIYHPRKAVIGKTLAQTARDFPSLAKITAASLGGKASSGYYSWRDADGRMRDKFMYMYPVDRPTADGVRVMLTATAYLDDFNAPSDALAAKYAAMSAGQLSSLSLTSRHIYQILLAIIIGIQFVMAGFLGFMFVHALRSQRKLEANNKELAQREVELMIAVQEVEIAKDDIEQERSRIKQLVESIGSILIAVDDQMRITQWNRRASEVFGVPLTRTMDQMFWGCGIQWNWPEMLDNIEKCMNQGSQIILRRFPCKLAAGKPGMLSLIISPIKNAEHETTGVVIDGEDVTEVTQLQSQLVQAQKLESIGQLAAGIAHEINTPIQYVGDNARFFKESSTQLASLMGQYKNLLQALKNDQDVQEIIEQIESTATEIDLDYLESEIPVAIEQTLEGVDRVSKIVLAMKEFSHPDDGHKTPINLNRAIESTITVSRTEWKYVADMKTDLDPNLPQVPCLPGELNQVILNMIVNAAHAIIDKVGPGAVNGKGEISIATHEEGDWAKISISDTGMGIPAAIRERVYDPFFTTKEVGRGTGQGLALAHNVIVKKHGGKISFDTEEGKGTTFNIFLPISVESAKGAAA